MPGVQVLHIEKRVSISGGLNRHITRLQWVNGKLTVWVPDNANQQLTKNNVELISREFANSAGRKTTLSLQQVVNKRIEDAGIKPRKGQTRSLEMIFSGSPEVMCNMNCEQLLKWADDTLKWAQKTWGKENVVSASLHVDEKTPHIHMIVVPIVNGQSRRSKKQMELDKERGITRSSYKINHDKLRLCCNDVFTTPLLYYYHDHYADEVSKKYGLERGLRAEPGSKKKHQTSEDYNRQLAAEAKEKQSVIAEIKSDYRSVFQKKKDAEREQKEAEDKFKDVKKRCEEKETYLKSLSSMGLLKMIQSIPALIKADIQKRVNIYWRGEVQSFEKVQYSVGDGEAEDFFKIDMINGDNKYFIEVRQATGEVYLNGAKEVYKWQHSGKGMVMPFLASYFTTEATDEAIQLVQSLYKAPEKTEEVVWNCHLGEYKTRIIFRKKDGKYELQCQKYNHQEKKYFWEKTTAFKSYKELDRDDTCAFLKITHSNGDNEYINQLGEKLNREQLKSLGISSGGYGIGGRR